MPENIIEVEDLNFWYGDHQALREVSFSVNKHQVTAIIGPSGCGKSTFLKTLNRMYEIIPESRVEGKVLFMGENILTKDVDVYNLRKQIGMVFQKPNPFPKSIYNNIAYGLRINRMNSNLQRQVHEALKRAALWDEVKDKLNTSGLELSGGQQQRLCIARALAINPQVLLMDEPCSALDPIATAKIEDLIDELKSEYTVIIVTHNMQQAARVSDITCVFLTGGELVEVGKTEKIFENPANKRVEDYITGKFG